MSQSGRSHLSNVTDVLCDLGSACSVAYAKTNPVSICLRNPAASEDSWGEQYSYWSYWSYWSYRCDDTLLTR
jgi:hypothetical protein